MVCLRPIRAYCRHLGLKTHRIVHQPQHHLTTKPLGLSIYLLFFTGSPVNGSAYSFNAIWSYSKSSFIWFWIYSCIFFAFSLQYPHNIPCTRNVCSHIYISGLHVSQISSVCFFLSDTQQSMKRSF